MAGGRPRRERGAGQPSPLFVGRYRGRAVLLTWTGMGRQKAEAGVEAVLARYRPDVVVAIGFSGALAKRLRVADLLLPSELMGLTGPAGDGVEPSTYRPDRELLDAATAALGPASQRVVIGPAVTAPGVVAPPAEKQSLSRQTGALAVDMESYWVARQVAVRGIPFLAVRAISDALEDRLPPFDEILNADGRPRVDRLAAGLLREPAGLAAVLSLARNAGRARRALAVGVACAVAAL